MAHDGRRAFSGKVAFITGAGSGMGQAMAQEFAERGADVVACDIAGPAAQATADRHGGLAITADVGDEEQVQRGVGATLDRFGRIDILCSNAGLLDGYASALDTPPQLWERVMRVNLTGTYLLVRAVLPGMLAQGSGSVITTCSLSSFVAGGGGAAYTASKHGLLGFTRQLAYDYAAAGIRANAICPGLIETGMTAPLLDDPQSGARKFVEETPSNTWGQPAEVAKLAAFLASDDAPFINGASVAIDGGWTIK
jgi:NAD(P)-dependent dehydrogenase (short-subunit alcohol dehydrogenase family)